MAQGLPGERVGPIEQVKSGMAVVDLAGRDVGRVELIKMGDPTAVTTQGHDAGTRRSLAESFWRAFGEGQPRIPEQFAQRLLRVGFVRVDASGLFGRDLYVAADQIDRVAGDVVFLRVTGDQLVKEHP